MGWTPPDGINVPEWIVEITLRETSVSEVTTIGLDIAKQVFHAHGADQAGRTMFSRKITRSKLLGFFAAQPACLVAMEACGGAHHWARELTRLGHTVRLIPPAYVKPFVKRHKNNAVDAEAICEAVQRPGMRFVAVKTEAQQAAAMVFRTRDLLVRQRTQFINALRPSGGVRVGGPAGNGPHGDARRSARRGGDGLVAAASGAGHVEGDDGPDAELDGQVAELDKEIARRAREDDAARRLMTIPGIGPVTATAIIALAPAVETFSKGRDFSAWLGLTPLQSSTGGKQKLGAISKMGERTIRRLLIIGASAVVKQAVLRGAPAGSWLERMLARKPRMLVSVVLANKMARTVWALLTRQENYKVPAAATA